MPSHSEGPGIWLSVWRFLLTHCLYERAAEVLARLRKCAGSPEPSLLALAISIKFAWRGPFNLPLKPGLHLQDWVLTSCFQNICMTKLGNFVYHFKTFSFIVLLLVKSAINLFMNHKDWLHFSQLLIFSFFGCLSQHKVKFGMAWWHNVRCGMVP